MMIHIWVPGLRLTGTAMAVLAVLCPTALVCVFVDRYMDEERELRRKYTELGGLLVVNFGHKIHLLYHLQLGRPHPLRRKGSGWTIRCILGCVTSAKSTVTNLS